MCFTQSQSLMSNLFACLIVNAASVLLHQSQDVEAVFDMHVLFVL